MNNTPGNILDDLHDFSDTGSTMWHGGCTDAGIAGGIAPDCSFDPFTEPVVDDQIVDFDLGGTFALVDAHIWQMNQGNGLAAARGVDEFEILVSTDGASFNSLGLFNLTAEAGDANVAAQVVSLGTSPVMASHVRFNINTEHGNGEPDGTEFVGLSEVRFTEALQTGFPGDFNGDNVVNAADYTNWRDNLGDADEGAINNNGDGAGGVDQADYGVWVQNFGNSQGAATALPEPAAAILYVFAMLLSSLASRVRLQPAKEIQ